MLRQIIRIDEEKCNGCGLCARRLPQTGCGGLCGKAYGNHSEQQYPERHHRADGSTLLRRPANGRGNCAA